MELDKRADALRTEAGTILAGVIDWAEIQFRAMGRPDARELAVALIAAYEGIALLAATLRDPSLISAEGDRLTRWIDSLKLSINVASLAGHNDIRKRVMGRANRDASAAEMQQMEQLMDKAMKDGAVGLSTGLIYIPGTYTKTPEIVSLAKIAARYDGVYATHMRDEADSVTQAINEALTIGREAHIPVEISHFKLSGQQNWGRSKETVGMI